MAFVGLAFLLLALFDAWFTARRIPQLGIEAEYNPFIRWLSYRFNIETGIYVGVLVPTLILLVLGVNFPSLLLFMTGCRTTLCSFQLKVLFDKNVNDS